MHYESKLIYSIEPRIIKVKEVYYKLDFITGPSDINLGWIIENGFSASGSTHCYQAALRTARVVVVPSLLARLLCLLEMQYECTVVSKDYQKRNSFCCLICDSIEGDDRCKYWRPLGPMYLHKWKLQFIFRHDIEHSQDYFCKVLNEVAKMRCYNLTFV